MPLFNDPFCSLNQRLGILIRYVTLIAEKQCLGLVCNRPLSGVTFKSTHTASKKPPKRLDILVSALDDHKGNPMLRTENH